MRFSDVARVYRTGESAKATSEVVSHPAVGAFSQATQKLQRSLAELDEDEHWGPFLRRARRTRWEIACTPLNLASDALRLADTCSYLEGLLAAAESHYPEQLLASARLVCQTLRSTLDGGNPLGDRVVAGLSASEGLRVGLLVRTRYFADVRGWLAGHIPNAAALTETDLSTWTHFDLVVAVGPSSWFVPFILSAPRASHVHFIHFDWMKDRQPSGGLFESTEVSPGVSRISIGASPPVADAMNALDVIPAIDWSALSSRSSAGGGSSEADVISANLFILAGGFSVWLEAVDGPTVHVVDIDSGRLHQAPTRSLIPGTFVVLRSAGGSGDYITEVADRHLGAASSRVRGLQRLWKEHLRTTVRETGMRALELDLKARGVRSPNLRYRLWQHSIRSREPMDFRILMERIGLGERADEIWTAMGQIHDAHLKAGQEIRHSLEVAVSHADLEELRRTGHVDVRLDQVGAGALSVFRIEARSPSPSPVSEHDLRIVEETDPDLWHE